MLHEYLTLGTLGPTLRSDRCDRPSTILVYASQHAIICNGPRPVDISRDVTRPFPAGNQCPGLSRVARDLSPG